MTETNFAQKLQVSPKSSVKAVLAGAGVAIVAGLLWFLIAHFTHCEIGYVAVAIGLGVGYAVRYFAPKHNFAMGAVAALLAVIGILLGKLCMLEAAFAPDAPAGYIILHQEAMGLGGTQDEHLVMYILIEKIESGELPDAFGKLDNGEIDYHTAVKELKANWKIAKAEFDSLPEAKKTELREKLTNVDLLNWYTQEAIAEGKLKQTVTLEQLEELAERGDEKALTEAAGIYGEESVKNAGLAQKMLDKLSAEEKFALIQEMKSDHAEESAELHSEVRTGVFKGMFGIYDIAFFFAALYAAYSLAGKDELGKKPKKAKA